MKTSIKKKIAALSAVVLMAASFPAIAASAAESNVYTLNYTFYSSLTCKYYDTYTNALNASGGVAAYVHQGNYGNNGVYAGSFYSTYTGRYYNTYNEALAASNYISGYVIQVNNNTVVNITSSTTFSSTYCYYSSYTNRYYSSYMDAVTASNGIPSYVTYKGSGTAVSSSTARSAEYPYYSSLTRKYYATYEDALLASNGASSYVSYSYNGVGYTGSKVTSDVYTPAFPYYSSYTNLYYSTQAAALAASRNNSYYVRYYGSTNYYVYAGNTYYTAYDALYNPYYYYYNFGYPTYRYVYSDASSTSAADGIPYYYGNNKVWGWTVLSNRMTNAKAGSVIAVAMNGSDVVPSEVFKAVKGRDITVQFLLNNGALWTVYGGNVTGTSEACVSVNYNSKTIPSTLTDKAAVDSVTSAEIYVGSSDHDLDFKGSLTVKFDSKRAGCFVKAYHYDSDSKSLRLVAKTMVEKDGHTTLTVGESGAYFLVLS